MKSWILFYLFQWSGLTKALPPNLQILTLQEWDDGKLLLRLEHLYQPKEDEQLSQDVTIELDVRIQSFKLNAYIIQYTVQYNVLRTCTAVSRQLRRPKLLL